jgi:hypothetical protein
MKKFILVLSNGEDSCSKMIYYPYDKDGTLFLSQMDKAYSIVYKENRHIYYNFSILDINHNIIYQNKFTPNRVAQDYLVHTFDYLEKNNIINREEM